MGSGRISLSVDKSDFKILYILYIHLHGNKKPCLSNPEPPFLKSTVLHTEQTTCFFSKNKTHVCNKFLSTNKIILAGKCILL